MWKWLRGLLFGAGKKLAIWIIQEEGDKLQESVKHTIRSEGPKAIDGAFERWEFNLCARIDNLKFLPSGLKATLCESLKSEGNKLKESLKVAALSGGTVAIDSAFDKFQEILIARVGAL